MADPDNEIFFRSASGCEIFQNVRLVRLIVPAKLVGKLSSVVRDEGWVPLPLTRADTALAALIKHEHRDPFDRMLAAQCRIGHFLPAFVDGVFDEFLVQRIGWAGCKEPCRVAVKDPVKVHGVPAAA